MMLTAGEIQGYCKAGAKLTPKGFVWAEKWATAQKQIATFAYIRGLHMKLSYMKDYNVLISGNAL